MNLPKRKQILLHQFDYSFNNTYFVTIFTYNRVHLFGEIESHFNAESVGAHLRVRPNNPDKLIKKWLCEAENKYENLTINKFIVMPDHIHMIIDNPGVYEEATGAHTGRPYWKS